MNALIKAIASLGQPSMGSIYDETGTPVSGYEEHGPYHCEDCIHKTAKDEPFCIHPAVLGDPKMQDRIVLLDGRPVAKVNMQRGCCKYVRQPVENSAADQDTDSSKVKSISDLIADEHQAVQDYGKKAEQVDASTAEVLFHIQGEERHHAQELKQVQDMRIGKWHGHEK